jgi:hypothetical protein
MGIERKEIPGNKKNQTEEIPLAIYFCSFNLSARAGQ